MSFKQEPYAETFLNNSVRGPRMRIPRQVWCAGAFCSGQSLLKTGSIFVFRGKNFVGYCALLGAGPPPPDGEGAWVGSQVLRTGCGAVDLRAGILSVVREGRGGRRESASACKVRTCCLPKRLPHLTARAHPFKITNGRFDYGPGWPFRNHQDGRLRWTCI